MLPGDPFLNPLPLGMHLDVLGSAAIYEASRARATAAPATFEGHRVYWGAAGALRNLDLVADAASYPIAGKTAGCDIVLPDEAGLAKRHLVLRSMRGPEGELVLRVVLDLATTTGFRLGAGDVQTSILVEGPIMLQIGRSVLVALPTLRMPEEIPALSFADTSAGARSRPIGTTSVRSLPHVLDAFQVTTLWPSPSSFTLERRFRRETVLLSDADLERGVIVGRSPKATPEVLSILDTAV